MTFGYFERLAGLVSITGSEDLTLTDPAVFPWAFALDGTPQPITGVFQNGVEIGFNVPTIVANEAHLSFIGGAFIIGGSSGLPLQAFSDFELEVS